MNILHLTTFLQGGAGLAIAELAGAQRQAGHAVTVVTSATGVPGYGNYPGHLEDLSRTGVPVHLVDSSFARDTAANQHVIEFLTAAMAHRPYDLIHAHAAVPSQIGLAVARIAGGGLPVIQTMHGWGIAKTPAQQEHDIAVMNLVDRVVVPAKTSAELLTRLGVQPSRIAIVPYGVRRGRPQPTDVADGVMAEMREWRRGGGTIACCIGTLGERKNQRLLVEALAGLDGRVLCVFIGDGDKRPLEALAAESGVSGVVRFAGYRASARRFLRLADMLVLPSLSEGQPLSVLEAYSDGVPVLASDVPELAELVEPGVTGALFDPRNPMQLAAAIEWVRRLTSDARRALGDRARFLYESRFTVEAMVSGYMHEYARTR